MYPSILGFCLWASTVLAAPQGNTAAEKSKPQTPAGPDSSGKYTLYGDGIRAQFIPYGASISNLFINSSSGVELDIILGFDNASYYSIDKSHPHLGGVPGRYANRIRNSTFEIDGKEYNILPNEHPTADHPDGVNTLHGGPKGWDWRNWTVVSYTRESITFSLVDPDGEQGFPGEVISYVTYTLGNMTWDIRMVALATTKVTPIMLSSHAYWNLDGFTNNETATALNHTVWLPYGGQRVATDDILIPTGDILSNEKGGTNDFWSKPKQLGSEHENPKLLGNCGGNCTGYDNCYIFNRPTPTATSWRSDLAARVHSPFSGIQLDIYTDQDAFQVYSCIGQNGSLALKSTQGLHGVEGRERVVEKYGCVVLEVQDWIDGINHEEWGRSDRQIFRPGGDPYVLQASYVFSVNGTRA